MKIRIEPANLAILSFYVYIILYPLVSFVTNVTGGSVVCDIIIVLCILAAIGSNIKVVKIDAVLLIICCFAAFCLSAYLFPEYREIIFNAETGIFTNVFCFHRGIILYFLIRMQEDREQLFKTLRVCAFLTWIGYTIRALSGEGLSELGSNHTYGYAFLFVSLTYFGWYIKSSSKKYLLMFIISTLQIILHASRTAILSLVLFIVIYNLFINSKKKNARRVIFLISIGLLGLILTSDAFIQVLSDVMERLDISSKILNAYISGDFEMDGGRLMMYENDVGLLRDNFWGLGLYWDRFYYPRFNYTHNLIFEILLDFGWILGGIIIVSLFVSTIKMLKYKQFEWQMIFFIFFCSCMVRLFLSYSFWLDANFWAMLAVYSNIKSNEKNGVRK